ncbi:MAG: M12 family metallo-peptidase, partial [Bacteroidota bacterium]
PYRDASSPGDFLDINASVINPLVGGGSYDIGHVFTTSSGGVAVLGSVCTGNKAAGTTGVSSPVGDPFDIDFVAHELGHQFGGRHTFNGTQGSCAGNNRSSTAAYEPGSGTTIMAYAGICGSDNLQNNSDPFFHAKSLDEIFEFSNNASGNNCAVITSTGNAIPIVEVNTEVFTIPPNTPFTLTATGSDADGDNLTYSWEQYDLGPAGAPSTPTGSAPLFRAFNPTTSPSRTFPRLETLLSGSSQLGEVLPTETRELNFRVVVRDNNPIGGAINTADMMLMVDGSSDPFRVSSQLTSGTSYTAGSVQEVEWRVAGTDGGNINVAEVRILFSDNGGQSFDYVLDEATANDGFALVNFPEVTTTQGRIKIEALENVFFDINDRDFELTEATAPEFFISVDPLPFVICAPSDATFEVSVDGTGGFDETVTLSLDGLDASLSGVFEDNTLAPGEQTILTISGTADAPKGTNDFMLQGNSSSVGDVSLAVDFEILDGSSGVVSLSFPEQMSGNNDLLPTFQWSESDVAESYSIELATDAAFTNVVQQRRSHLTNSISFNRFLEEGTTYYWRVAVLNQCGQGDFTTGQFTTAKYDRTETTASDLNIAISPQGTPTITSVINVTEDIILEDLNILDLDITHSYVEDLTVTLRSPAGTEVRLFSGICGDLENVLLSFDDETLETTADCDLTSNKTVQPLDALSAFNGENSQGDWTLTIEDGADQDGGSLNGWGLQLGAIGRDLILSLGSVSSDEVVLSWEEAPTLSGVTGFEISLREGDGSFQEVGTVSSEAVSATVENLSGETNYAFRVRAAIGSEFSDFSNIVQILTTPGAPEGINAVINNTGAIIVSWIDNFETELGFVLEIKEGDGEFEVLEILAPDENNFVLSGSSFDEAVSFRVKAFNETGDSPYSEVFILSISDVNELQLGTRLFPNPGSGFARLQLPAGITASSISFTDISGKSLPLDMIEEQTGHYIINTEAVPSGLYFIQIQSDDEAATLRWLKE